MKIMTADEIGSHNRWPA